MILLEKEVNKEIEIFVLPKETRNPCKIPALNFDFIDFMSLQAKYFMILQAKYFRELRVKLISSFPQTSYRRRIDVETTSCVYQVSETYMCLVFLVIPGNILGGYSK